MLEATQAIEDNFNSYEVDLPAFQGPLDLLLNLIEAEELDITKISLARVTDQYLAHLEILQDTDPNDLTDFLVIAAKLILIKSEVLLPRPPPILVEEEEENVGDELARQLRLYKKFKEIASHLRELEDKGERNFVRVMPGAKLERRLLADEGDMTALLAAARQAFMVKPPEPDVDEMVAPQVVTIGQQMLHIWQSVSKQRRISFQELVGQVTYRIEVIVTLLAILELIKRNAINVKQPERFGNIIISQKTERALSEEELEELVGMTDVS